ncbi:hypothetical protein [Oleiagrimonas soli]|uniref:Uncharacterized protein n=1 Tax=Oleiagrimonas soli TaxID=1543381 RepID=A0A099CZL7_9GAMM|nr:hypothetical protein [Oleiagrimonas soli]KGI79239.1 hypothetical protein LF63_0100170 [Oleiagrimonas soli]MBB6184868.1 hypothetical protein [Oleiagrimonas soli]
MKLLLILALLLALTVVPVMIGARIVKAQNTGFGSALLAVILLAALGAAIDHFVPYAILAVLISALGGAAILAGVLNTTFLRGLAVSVIVTLIQFLALLLFMGSIVGAD